jgi:ankyrin repeat protein
MSEDRPTTRQCPTAPAPRALGMAAWICIGAFAAFAAACGKPAEQAPIVKKNEAPPVAESAIAKATIASDIPEIKSLLEAGGNINAKDALGRTPLHMAAFYGNTKTTEFLIANGADLNARDLVGMTPLHIAVISGGRQEVEVLLEKKAQINAKSDVGQTALHLAAATGQPKLSRFLIEHGADPQIKDADGKTPLAYAIQNKHPQATAVLQKYTPKTNP